MPLLTLPYASEVLTPKSHPSSEGNSHFPITDLATSFYGICLSYDHNCYNIDVLFLKSRKKRVISVWMFNNLRPLLSFVLKMCILTYCNMYILSAASSYE